MKVYCEDCVFYCREKSYAFYDKISFFDSNKSIHDYTDLCAYNDEVNYIDFDNPVFRYRSKTVKVNNPSVFNKNNDCQYYKKKLWKFWIK